MIHLLSVTNKQIKTHFKGIKPCVSAFGGNQFHPSQTRYLETFFSVFYLSINVGSLISTVITPIFRADVKCFGNQCFTLSFGVPSVVFFLGLVLFVCGTPFYNRDSDKKSGQNIIFQTFGCISYALSRKLCSRDPKRSHWLDHSDRRYSPELIEDVKALCKVIIVFLPLPIFWALYDQQGSRWTSQAQQLSGRIGSFTIKPDQFQAINPISVVALVPVFDYILYPFLAKFNMFKNLLTRMAVGLVFAIAAFCIAAVLESQMQSVSAALNKPNQLRAINLSPCSLTIEQDKYNLDMRASEYFKNRFYDIPTGVSDKFFGPSVNATADLTVTAKCSDKTFTSIVTIDNFNLPKNLIFYRGEGTDEINVADYEYYIEKQEIGSASIRVNSFGISSDDLANISVEVANGKYNYDNLNVTHVTANMMRSGGGGSEGDPRYKKVNYADDFKIQINNMGNKSPPSVDLLLESCGKYSFLIFYNGQKIDFVMLSDVYPNGLSIFWQLIQIFVMTMGEIMFSISGLAFAYSQAPPSMKSVLQSIWQLTVAFGNLIVVIVAEAKFVNNQVYEYLIFAGMLGVATVAFGFLGFRYKYAKPHESESSSSSGSSPNDTNSSYEKADLNEPPQNNFNSKVGAVQQYDKLRSIASDLNMPNVTPPVRMSEMVSAEHYGEMKF
jgi:dipeptide/tripeptide permease